MAKADERPLKFARPVQQDAREILSESDSPSRDDAVTFSRPSTRRAQKTKLRWLPYPSQPIQQVSLEKRGDEEPVARLSFTRPARSTTTVATADGFENLSDEQDQKVVPSQLLEGPRLAELPQDELLDDELLMDEPLEELPPSESPESELDYQLAQAPSGKFPPCPSPNDFKRIGEITNDVAPTPGEFPPECPLGNEPYMPRNWAMTTFAWKASGICHKPLYFEELALERYGHSCGPFVQPVASMAHFFVTLPILPYKMGMDPPWECVYALGYYRPGSCAPYMIYPIPLSLRGGLVQAGAVVGTAFLIP